jgi:hypothetical protein
LEPNLGYRAPSPFQKDHVIQIQKTKKKKKKRKRKEKEKCELNNTENALCQKSGALIAKRRLVRNS